MSDGKIETGNGTHAAVKCQDGLGSAPAAEALPEEACEETYRAVCVRK